MSVEWLTICLHHSRATGTAKVVLLGIANHDGDNGAWPAVITLAKYANVSARNVEKALAQLEELGEIRRHLQAGRAVDKHTGQLRPKMEQPNLYEILVRCPEDCDRSPKHLCASELAEHKERQRRERRQAAERKKKKAAEAAEAAERAQQKGAADLPSQSTGPVEVDGRGPVEVDGRGPVEVDGRGPVEGDTQTVQGTNQGTSECPGDSSAREAGAVDNDPEDVMIVTAEDRPADEPSLHGRLRRRGFRWSVTDVTASVQLLAGLLGGGVRGEGLAGAVLFDLAEEHRDEPQLHRWLCRHSREQVLELPAVARVLSEQVAAPRSPAGKRDPFTAAAERAARLDAHPHGQAARDEARRVLGLGRLASAAAVDRAAEDLLREQASA